MEIKTKGKGLIPKYRGTYTIKNGFYQGKKLQVLNQKQDKYECRISEPDPMGGLLFGKEGDRIQDVTLSLEEFQEMVD